MLLRPECASLPPAHDTAFKATLAVARLAQLSTIRFAARAPQRQSRLAASRSPVTWSPSIVSESKDLDTILQKQVSDMEREIVDRPSPNGRIVDPRNICAGPWELLE